MDRRLIAGACVLVIVGAGSVVYQMLKGADTPGRNKAAEIIHPQTGQRFATTWDKVFSMTPPPRQDPFTGGGWQAQVPGTELWGYVVNAGARHPSEDRATQPAP